jgi:hypothetical protein
MRYCLSRKKNVFLHPEINKQKHAGKIKNRGGISFLPDEKG